MDRYVLAPDQGEWRMYCEKNNDLVVRPLRRSSYTREVAADGAYLDAQDADDPRGEPLRQFSLARLESALLLAAGAHAAELAADCLYEALSVLPEPRRAAQALLLTLS